MSYVTKEWEDRESLYPNRRTITNVADSTDTKIVEVSRAEGTVTKEGSPLNASALNDLEGRIANMNLSLVGSPVTVSLPAQDWNASTHLITVNVTGVTSASNQEIFGLLATSSANIQNNQKLQNNIVCRECTNRRSPDKSNSEELSMSNIINIGGGAGAGSGHNYSTTEQVVGTWIDGSTLYEKTFDLSSVSLTDYTWTNNLLGTTGIEIRKVDGFFFAFGISIPWNYYRADNRYMTWVLSTTGSDINCRPNLSTNDIYAGFITIQYTKSTS